MKIKCTRGNNKFMNKMVSKAFMNRLKMKNKFNKKLSRENEIPY